MVADGYCVCKPKGQLQLVDRQTMVAMPEKNSHGTCPGDQVVCIKDGICLCHISYMLAIRLMQHPCMHYQKTSIHRKVYRLNLICMQCMVVLMLLMSF